jgi:serine/threonine protein kinase
VFVDNSKIYSFSSIQQSLYHYLHNINYKFNDSQKISIALQLSGVLNALHVLESPVFHLHLSSRNVFIEERYESDKISEADLIVKIGDLGDIELRRYSKIFSKYEIRNVWSSPEILKVIITLSISLMFVLKDPESAFNDPKASMDVYSFGMLLWELYSSGKPLLTQ